jgi:uncharacterized coiled-coil protein SlyX
MRAAAIAAVAVAGALLAADSHAQTSAQWSQLVGYVGQQSRVILEMRGRIERLEAENAQQRETINATITQLDQQRCRVSRLTVAFKDYTGNVPPTQPQWVDGVSCIDLKSAVPPFPALLPSPM